MLAVSLQASGVNDTVQDLCTCGDNQQISDVDMLSQQQLHERALREECCAFSDIQHSGHLFSGNPAMLVHEVQPVCQHIPAHACVPLVHQKLHSMHSTVNTGQRI